MARESITTRTQLRRLLTLARRLFDPPPAKKDDLSGTCRLCGQHRQDLAESGLCRPCSMAAW